MQKFILFFFVLMTFAASAQKGKSHTGVIITATGDTLKGSYHCKKNPGPKDSLYIQLVGKEEDIAYAWSGLKYFGIPGDDDHIVCPVKRNLEYIDPYSFNIMLKDSVITQTIPLTAVYTGSHFSLYKFYGPSDYFFISDGENVIQLVQTYRYLTNHEQMFYGSRVPRYFINYTYRSQLLAFFDFDADQKMYNLLENTEYKEYQLKTLISKMDKKFR